MVLFRRHRTAVPLAYFLWRSSSLSRCRKNFSTNCYNRGMVIIDYRRTELLFTKYDLRASLEAGRNALATDADHAPVSADSTDAEIEQLAISLADKHSVVVPVLNEAEIYTSSERRQLDVSQDFNRAIFDRSQPFMLELEAVVFHVPFTGDRELFFMRASTFSFNPPRAEVADHELRIAVLIEGDATSDQVKQQFEQELAHIKQPLGWVSEDVGLNYNERLVTEAHNALEAKRNRQTSTRGLLDGLGFKTTPTDKASVPHPALRAHRATTTKATATASVALPEKAFAYDFFISHASEDKNTIARPLYEELTKKGYSVWFDEAELHIGDSLLDKIDEGLANCRFGIVVMSPRFFEKKWTQDDVEGPAIATT